MADYATLAPVKLTAKDLSAQSINSGNWTNAFTTDVLPWIDGEYEIWHMAVSAGPALATAIITSPNLTNVFSAVQLSLSGANEWDPQQPLVLKSGGELYFLWASPVSGGNAPVVTVWPRYNVNVAVPK